MKVAPAVLLMLLASTLLCACQIGSPRGGTSPRQPSDDPLLASIDLAGELPYYRDRREVLNDLARRNDLHHDAVILIIDTAMQAMDVDTGREKVLLTLIANPAFTPAGEQHLLSRIDHLKYAGTKNRILKALQQRNMPRR